ncbi:hypothetical protein MTR67_027388 [Solanum verrucosum]|uniref:NADH dehydrogenase n=1 Tax=Solanum verrucosum TaxID=315347 RepID=A0AAF0R3J9_SOLVR|nr:hypothetical protein MTR67_027388 [Solanum verrucosum]
MFLRRIARPLMMMAKVKETTGIVGLEVVPNAREVLINLYRKTLEEIKAVPEDEGYRKAVESFTRHRLNVCVEERESEMIEKRLGCGQVEELIEEAQDELKLIGHMNGLHWINVSLFVIFSLSLFLEKAIETNHYDYTPESGNQPDRLAASSGKILLEFNSRLGHHYAITGISSIPHSLP